MIGLGGVQYTTYNTTHILINPNIYINLLQFIFLVYNWFINKSRIMDDEL